MRFFLVVSCWLASTAAFYAFACYFAYGYRRADDPAPLGFLDAIQPKDASGITRGIVKTFVMMMVMLSGIVAIYKFFPNLAVHIDSITVFLSLFLMGTLLRKGDPDIGIGSVLYFFGCGLFAWFGLSVFKENHSWIIVDGYAVMALAVVLTIVRRITGKQCLAISAGIMIYDAFSVFGTHQMQAMASISDGRHFSGMLMIPAGLSPHAETAFELGMGDMLIPGLTILFAYRSFSRLGAVGAIGGYLAGLIVTLVVGICFHADQPATIYLIPCVWLGFWFVTGRWRSLPEPMVIP